MAVKAEIRNGVKTTPVKARAERAPAKAAPVKAPRKTAAPKAKAAPKATKAAAVDVTKSRWVQWKGGRTMLHLHEATTNEKVAGTMALCGVPAPADAIGVATPTTEHEARVCQFCARIAVKLIAGGTKVPPLPKPPKGQRAWDTRGFKLPTR